MITSSVKDKAKIMRKKLKDKKNVKKSSMLSSETIVLQN